MLIQKINNKYILKLNDKIYESDTIESLLAKLPQKINYELIKAYENCPDGYMLIRDYMKKENISRGGLYLRRKKNRVELKKVGKYSYVKASA